MFTHVFLQMKTFKYKICIDNLLFEPGDWLRTKVLKMSHADKYNVVFMTLEKPTLLPPYNNILENTKKAEVVPQYGHNCTLLR